MLNGLAFQLFAWGMDAPGTIIGRSGAACNWRFCLLAALQTSVQQVYGYANDWGVLYGGEAEESACIQQHKRMHASSRRPCDTWAPQNGPAPDINKGG